MSTNTHSLVLKLAASAAMLALIGCTATTGTGTPLQQAQISAAEQTRTVTLRKGEVLQLYTEDRNADALQAREALLEATAPLASRYGLKAAVEFAVRATAAGEFKPNSVSLHTAPSLEALTQLSSSADWQAVQPARAAAYNDMKTYSDVVEDNVTLTFDPAKLYTVGIFWVNHENPGDLEFYLDGLKPTVEELGGRFIYYMNDPAISAISTSQPAPGRVIFIEWSDPANLSKLSTMPRYQELQRYRISGTTEFEFHIIQPQMN